MIGRRAALACGVGLLTATLAACGGTRPEDAVGKIAQGDQLMAKKDYSAAVIEYRNAVVADGKSGEARHKLALAYASLNDSTNALNQFVRAADLLPNDPKVQLDAARALLLAGRFEDARARAEGVLATAPNNVDAHVLRATATAGLRDVEGAISSIQEALKLEPDRSGAYLDLAVLQAAQGDQAQAEAAFKQAVAVAPQSVRAHLALANYYWTRARLEECEKALMEAVRVAPKDVGANRTLATFYMGTRRAAQAEGPLRIAAESGGNEVQLVLADYYIGQGRPADARPILESLAKDKDAFAAATVRLAGVEFESGRRDQAYSMVEQVLAREPRNVQVLVVKGGWLVSEGKLDEAQKVAESAVAAESRFAPAQSLLGSIYVKRNDAESAAKVYTEVLKLTPGDIPAQVAMADLNVALGKADAAVQFAQQAVRNQPTNGVTHLALARALVAAGENARAREELRLVIDSRPTLAVGHALLGRVQLAEKDRVGARRSFERALELDADALDALNGLVSLDVADKRVPDAIRRVDAQLALKPNNAPLLILAARTYATGGDLVKAESTLRKAIAANPSQFEAYSILGELYLQQNKLDQARQEFERIVQQRPGDVGAQTMVGIVLQIQNKPAEAQKIFERVVANDPRAVVASNNLAYMHAEDGTNLDVALTLAQTAKSASPDNADVSDTLGWVYYKRDLAALAIPPLTFSVGKDPNNALYHFHLGMAYMKNSEQDRGRQSLEKALQLGLGPSETAEARRALTANTR